jgi:predicted transcriptional regulator
MDALPQFRRDILVSIQPRYASKILDGRKTVELRRRFPDPGAMGALALIYSSSPVCAIVGFARIKQVARLPLSKIWKEFGAAACISKNEFKAYFKGLQSGYVISFENVQPLTPCVAAEELERRFGIVPPQSYRYVGSDCIALLSNECIQRPYRHKRGDRAGRPAAHSDLAR